MFEFEWSKKELIQNGDGWYTGDHLKSFGSMEQNRDVEVRDGGYVREGVGGWLTFTNDGVDGSSFFIPNLFTPNLCPSTLDSTRRFPILHLLFYFFCAQSAILFLIA